MMETGTQVLDHPKFYWGQVRDNLEEKQAEIPVNTGVHTDSPVYPVQVHRSTVCVDWFQVMLRGVTLTLLEALPEDQDEYHLGDDLCLLRMRYLNGEKVRSGAWKNSWELIAFGEPVAILNTGNPQPEKFGDGAQFRVYNQFLYQKGWTDTLNEFLQVAELTIKSVTRLDIAKDGLEDLAGKVQELVQSDQYRQKGRAKIAPHDVKDGQWDGLKIGSTSSEIHGTLYRKDKELEKSGKQWIKDFWNRNRLDSSGEVHRLEVRIKWARLKRLDDWETCKDLGRLEDASYLASLLRTAVQNWFEYEYTGKDSNTRRRANKQAKGQLINWENMGGELLDRKPRRVKQGDIAKARTTVRNLIHFKIVNGHPITWEQIDQVAEKEGQLEWLREKEGYLAEKAEKERLRRQRIESLCSN